MSKKTDVNKVHDGATCYKQLNIPDFYLNSPQALNGEIPAKVTKKYIMKKKKKKKKTSSKKICSKSDTKQNLPSVLTWICQDLPSSQSMSLEAKETNDKSEIQSDFIGDRMSNSNNTKSVVGIKRHSSDSFARYGVKVPSLDDILRYQKKLKEFEKSIAEFDLMDDYIEPVNFNIDVPKKHVEILDCKHLTVDQLKVSLQQNYQYLYDIHHGISLSERHKRFQNEDFRNNFTVKDLKYNTSMITFTYEQKQILLDFLFEKFDKSEYGSNMQYFFKVLLPELCTKIFMDTYNMTYDEATVYLNNRPVG